MKLLDRYVGVHVVLGTVLALSVLLAIFTFIEFVDDLGAIGQGSYGLGHAVLHVLLTSPQRAFLLFPVAAVVGSLMGLGVLASNRELTVLRAAGVSTGRLTVAVLKAAGVLVIAAVAIGELVVPGAEQFARERRAEALAERWSANSGAGFWARDGNTFINITEVLPGERLGGVYIYEFDEERRLRVATRAERATREEGQWRLHELSQSEIDADQVITRRVDRALWSSTFEPEVVNVGAIEPETLSVVGLRRYIGYLESNGLNSAHFRLAMWSKIVYPLSTAVMIFLTLPLVLGRMREMGVAPRVLIGSLVGVFFHIAHQASGHVGVLYGVSPVLSALVPTLAFLGAGIWLMRRVA